MLSCNKYAKMQNVMSKKLKPPGELRQKENRRFYEKERRAFEMAKRKVLEAVRFLKGCLDESGLRDSKVILFGSHAKGNARFLQKTQSSAR